MEYFQFIAFMKNLALIHFHCVMVIYAHTPKKKILKIYILTMSLPEDQNKIEF